jgi:hypothetical protein
VTLARIVDVFTVICFAIAISCAYRSWKMLYKAGPPVKVGYRNVVEFQRRRQAISDATTRSQLNRLDWIGGSAWIAGFALLVFGHFSQAVLR